MGDRHGNGAGSGWGLVPEGSGEMGNYLGDGQGSPSPWPDDDANNPPKTLPTGYGELDWGE